MGILADRRAGKAAALLMLVALSELVLLAGDGTDALAGRVWLVGSQLSQVEASGSNVYVLWQNNSPEENVYFIRSSDNGTTFGESIALGKAPPSGSAFGAQMAVSGEHVYVAWAERRFDEDYKVFFARSIDGGASFESSQILSGNDKGPSTTHQIIASGVNVYVVYIEEWAEQDDYLYDVKLRVSRDNGETFGDPVSLFPNLSHWNIRTVTSLAVHPHQGGNDDMIYVVAMDTGDCLTSESVRCGLVAEIFFSKSEDGGKVFSEPIVIERRPESLAAPEELGVPGPSWLQVSVDSNYVTVTWEDDNYAQDRKRSIFMARSSDNGVTFSDTVQVDKGTASYTSVHPILISTRNSTFVAWDNYNELFGYPNIVLARIDGHSVSTPIDVSGKYSIPYWFATSYGDNVYLAWNNSTRGDAAVVPRGTHVYFTFIEDGNMRLQEPMIPSHHNDLERLFAEQQKPLIFVAPKIAISGSHVYLGWGASYPESHELFFRGSSDGAQTFGEILELNGEKPGERFVSLGMTAGTATYPESSTKSFDLHYSLDEQEYRVAGNATDGVIVKSFTITPDIGIGFSIDAEKDGKVVLSLEKEMIRNVTSASVTYADLLVGTEMKEISSNSTHSVIDVSVPEGTDRLFIRAAHVVPEFPYQVLLALSAVIGTIIAISRTELLSRFYGTAT